MKTKVMMDGFEGHVRRSLARAAKMERGERLEPERITTFADSVDLLECLGPSASIPVVQADRDRIEGAETPHELCRIKRRLPR